MGAAGYVGRVGGLAVAMGVGAAILTGYGVASAEPDSAGSTSACADSAASTSSSDSANSPDAGVSERPAADSHVSGPVHTHPHTRVGSERPSGSGDTSAASVSPEPGTAEQGEVESTGSAPTASGAAGSADVVVEHHFSEASLPAAELISVTGDTGQPEVDVTPGATTSMPARSRQWDRAPARSRALAAPLLTRDAVLSTTVAPVDSSAEPTATTRISSEALAAARPVAAVTPPAAVGALAAPSAQATLQDPAAGELAPADALDLVSTSVVDLAGQLLNPFGDNAPAAPVDGPAEWLVAAVARRDLATAAPITSGPLTANPTVALNNGVIVGNLNATDAQSSLFYTVVGGPSAGGKVRVNPDGSFNFLPYGTVVDSRGTETFTVMVSEKPALIAALDQIPGIGPYITEYLAQPILVALHQVPILGDVLSPIIGYATTVPITVDLDALVPVGAPVAFTTRVASFDGALIRVNFFPAYGLLPGETAPTIFDGPGLASEGSTNPNTSLRFNGYNVVTWDPRGEFDSGGVLHIDSPFFEGRDMSAIFDWLAERPEAQLDAPGDPRIGMVGVSYGGGIQLVTAGIDDRVDAIVPEIAWHSMTDSLYKDGAFKTQWGTGLFLALVATGARLPGLLYEGIVTGNLFGVLSQGVQALAASSGPSVLVDNITAPTLLIQGTVDTLFTLQEATTNAAILDANGVPVKVIWFCGGHGACLSDDDDQDALIRQRTLQWLERYVKGNELVNTGPKFEYVDQNGSLFSSALLPSDPAFYGDPIVTSGGGGILPIVPLIGGSGPQTPAILPFSLIDAAPGFVALNMTTSAATETTQIVGTPQLTFTYSGLGTSRHVYAQLVDDKTGIVLGNIVTPIPVTLDGQTHTVTVSLEQVAQTMQPGDTLTLQLVGSAFLYENYTSVGVIKVSGMELTLPTANSAVVVAE